MPTINNIQNGKQINVEDLQQKPKQGEDAGFADIVASLIAGEFAGLNQTQQPNVMLANNQNLQAVFNVEGLLPGTLDLPQSVESILLTAQKLQGEQSAEINLLSLLGGQSQSNKTNPAYQPLAITPIVDGETNPVTQLKAQMVDILLTNQAVESDVPNKTSRISADTSQMNMGLAPTVRQGEVTFNSAGPILEASPVPLQTQQIVPEPVTLKYEFTSVTGAEQLGQPGEPIKKDKVLEDMLTLNLNQGLAYESKEITTPSLVKDQVTQLLQRVFGEMTYSNTVKVKSFHIKLEPEHLGSMMIKVSIEDGQLNARIVVENKGIIDLLNGQLSQLREALHNQGLSIGQMQVGLQQDMQSGFYQDKPVFIPQETAEDGENILTEFGTSIDTGRILDVLA